MLIVRGANVYPSQVQRSLLSVPGTGVEFVIIADREGTMDSVHVQVEYDPTIEPHDVPAFKKDLAAAVRARLENDTNINFTVEILDPETLERAVPKAKRVIDRRPSLRVAATA